MTTSNFFTAFYSALADARTYYELQKEMNVRSLENVYLNLFSNKTNFQAVVLSVNPGSTNSQTAEQSVRVRPLDLHNYILPEPCTVKSRAARKALISLHPVAYSAQVPTSIKADEDGSAKISPMSIRPGDIVICRFSDGPGNNGKMRGLTFEPMTRGSLPQSNMDLKCLRGIGPQGAAAMFGGGGYGPVPNNADYSTPYKIDDLQFRSISQNTVAQTALKLHELIGEKKFNESTAEGRSVIYNNIHNPLYRYFGKIPSAQFKTTYTDQLGSHAWSGWFLNASYLLSNSKHKKPIKDYGMGFADSGCCYPNPMAAKTRKNLLTTPEKYIGKSVYMIFSKEEVEKYPELALQSGDSAIVGQGRTKTWKEIKTEFVNVGGSTHMDIYVGDNKYVGGNISDSTSYRNTKSKPYPAQGFMKLVTLVRVKTKK